MLAALTIAVVLVAVAQLIAASPPTTIPMWAVFLLALAAVLVILIAALRGHVF